MGIKIKNKKPTLNEFSSKDLIVNPLKNKLFFKGKDEVIEVGGGLEGQWVKRDNNNIFYRSGSAQVLDDGTNNYIIELSAASTGPRINFGDHDSNNDSFIILGAFNNINQIDTKSRDFHLYGTTTTTGFYFDESAGKFGIGTTSPQSALHLASDTADVILTLEADISDDTESHNPAIKLLQDGGNVAGWLGIAGADSQWPDGTTLTGGLSNNLILGTSGSAGSDNEQLQFATVNNVRMTIDNDGNVGIGVNAPSELLEVQGSVDDDDIAILIQNTSDDDSASTPPRAALKLEAASNNAYFRCFGAPDDAAAGHQIDIGSTAGSSFLTFTPSNSEKMRLTSGGKLGIGTTAPSGFFHINEATGTAAGINGQGSLVLSHDDSGGVSSITFVSKVNSNSDYGYIQYEEDASDFGSTNENGLLTIGVENDGTASPTNEDAIKFRVNASDVLVIRGDGDIGIGTTSPSNLVHLKKDVSDYLMLIENGHNDAKGVEIKLTTVQADDNDSEEAATGNNNIFVRCSDGQGSVGSLKAEEGELLINFTSDGRLKQNIRAVQDIGIEDLLKIQVREFTWKKDKSNKKQHGFIAQEVEKIYPYAVDGEGNEDPAEEPMQISKMKFIPLIVKSMQDQQAQIEELKKRIKKLEDKWD